VTSRSASFWDRVLTAYGKWTPYHPGKWRVVHALEGRAKAAWTGPRVAYCQGLRYEMDPHSRLERRLFYLGCHERSESRFIAHLVKPDWIVVDVGANIGYYTLLLSRRVGSQGRVYAFEPARSNYQRLMRNITMNNATNVKVYQAALGDREGESSLVVGSPDNPEEIRLGRAGKRGRRGAR